MMKDLVLYAVLAVFQPCNGYDSGKAILILQRFPNHLI